MIPTHICCNNTSTVSLYLRAIGPAVGTMAICPFLLFSLGTAPPSCVILMGVGLKPQMPQKWAGMRIDPPM